MRYEKKSVDYLLDILLNSPNDVWRDDAAQELADSQDQPLAEKALIAAIESPKLDDSLRITCAESLASVWIKAGRVPVVTLNRLTGTTLAVVKELLYAEGLLSREIPTNKQS